MPKTRVSIKNAKDTEWKKELIKEVKGGQVAYNLTAAQLSMAIGAGTSRVAIDRRLKDPTRFSLDELKDLFKALKTDEQTQKKIIYKLFNWKEQQQ